MKFLILILSVLSLAACSHTPYKAQSDPPPKDNRVATVHWAAQDLQFLFQSDSKRRLSKHFSKSAIQAIANRVHKRVEKTLSAQGKPLEAQPSDYADRLRVMMDLLFLRDRSKNLDVVDIQWEPQVLITYRHTEAPLIPIYTTVELDVSKGGYTIKDYWDNLHYHKTSSVLEEFLYHFSVNKDGQTPSQDGTREADSLWSQSLYDSAPTSEVATQILFFKTLSKHDGTDFCQKCQDVLSAYQGSSDKPLEKFDWLLAMRSQNYEKALDLLPQVDPNIFGDAGIATIKAYYLIKLGRYRESMALLNHAIEADPLVLLPYMLAMHSSEHLNDQSTLKQLNKTRRLLFDEKAFNRLYKRVKQTI